MIQARNVSQSLKKKSYFIPIVALAAGVDAADIPIMRCPFSAELISINIIPQGDDAGIDASNTSVWLFEKGSTALGTKTYDNAAENGVAFPNKGTVDTIPLSGTIANLRLAEGDVITYSITNATTAATPASIVEIELIINDEAIFDEAHAANYSS